MIPTKRRRLALSYPDLGNGEPDLYIAFPDLFFELCKGQGVVAALIPGGLIRSQGTQVMRQKIFDASQSVSLSIIDNRARFFAIDTRFKFLAIALTKAGSEKNKREPINLLHERGTPKGLETTGTATLGRLPGVAHQQPAALHRDSLKPRVLHFTFESAIYKTVKFSDHAPITVDYEFDL